MQNFKNGQTLVSPRGYGMITGPELTERLEVETRLMARVNDGAKPRLPTEEDKRQIRQRGRCGAHGRRLI